MPAAQRIAAAYSRWTLPTTATVDRLLHHAHVVLTQDASYRLAEATSGKGVVPLG